jgi:hypothetical protein
MRGAGVRLSSPREGIPGPRRLILDGTTTGRHLATGATATALLASQRRNLAYLDAQRALLAEDETRADDEMRSPVEEREDHAAEVLGILRALPLLSGDFSGVFDEVADLAGIEQHGGVWEVRAVGGEAVPLPLRPVPRGRRSGCRSPLSSRALPRLAPTSRTSG